jgi:hypothetical protein
MKRAAFLFVFLVLGVPLASSIPRINPHPGGGTGASDGSATTYLDSISEFLSSMIGLLLEAGDWGGGGEGWPSGVAGAWWGADWEGPGWNGTEWNGTEWNETVVVGV